MQETGDPESSVKIETWDEGKAEPGGPEVQQASREAGFEQERGRH